MWILVLILIIFDGLIINYFPNSFNNLNYLYPMLTISIIPYLYLWNKKKYFKSVFIIGLIYDLLYSGIFLYNALIFLSLAKINKKVYSIFNNNLLTVIILTIINITIYDIINYLVVNLTKYSILDINILFNKISHSLLLNILVVFVIFFMDKKRLYSHKV